eukprot:361525-Chlamydomonas_euryale.AAC.6
MHEQQGHSSCPSILSRAHLGHMIRIIDGSAVKKLAFAVGLKGAWQSGLHEALQVCMVGQLQGCYGAPHSRSQTYKKRTH